MHTHIYFDSTAAEGTDLTLTLLLADGVTGIRDMCSVLDLVLHASEVGANHTMLDPRMVVAASCSTLKDIANTRAISGVVDGRYLPPDDLRTLRTHLRQLAAAQ